MGGRSSGEGLKIPRFFVFSKQIAGSLVRLSGDDARKISKVLRLSKGDQVRVFNDNQQEYLVILEEISEKEVLGKILANVTKITEPPVEIILLQGLTKGEKMDTVIQKGTELGVSEVRPVLTERSVSRPPVSKREQRCRRWQKIALEAACQSGRVSVPVVGMITDWIKVINNLPTTALKLICWEEEKSRGLRNILRANKKHDKVVIAIGPEGGFSETEVNTACAEGFIPVSLGPRILRTETAGPAVLAMLLYEVGDLGGTYS